MEEFYTHGNIVMGNDVQRLVYENIREKANKYCGELTDEIADDEFERTKWLECYDETEELYLNPKAKR